MVSESHTALSAVKMIITSSTGILIALIMLTGKVIKVITDPDDAVLIAFDHRGGPASPASTDALATVAR